MREREVKNGIRSKNAALTQENVNICYDTFSNIIIYKNGHSCEICKNENHTHRENIEREKASEKQALTTCTH